MGNCASASEIPPTSRELWSLLFKRASTEEGMGNANSSNTNAITGKRKESIDERNKLIRELGERYPFGDDELRKLVYVYESVLQTLHIHDKEDSSSSFLLTLALICTSDDYDKDEMKEKIIKLEKNILPKELLLNEKLKKILFNDSLETFLDGISKSQRRGTRTASKFLFELCSQDDKKQQANALEIVNLGYRLCLAAAYLKYDDDDLLHIDNDENNENELKSFSESLLSFASSSSDNNPGNQFNTSPFDTNTTTKLEEGSIAIDTFLFYVESKMPIFGSCISTFLHIILFPNKSYPASYTAFTFPRIQKQKSAFFDKPTSSYLFALSCFTPSLSGMWYRLYTSDTDGISFNRLLNALLGYAGPTILLIKESENGGIFGAYSSCTWKEGKDFYGDSDCFLFRLLPTLDIFGARGHKKHYVYCNPAARSKGYDELPHGIGFGGNFKQLRLFLSETFDDCIASSSDLTYEEGPLLPPKNEQSNRNSTTSALQQYLQSTNKRKDFDIHSLEVWGVGGDDIVQSALKARKQQRAIINDNIQKARKVDKAQFLDDFNNGTFESKAFKHKAQVHGHEVRTGFEDDDDNDNPQSSEK